MKEKDINSFNSDREISAVIVCFNLTNKSESIFLV